MFRVLEKNKNRQSSNDNQTQQNGYFGYQQDTHNTSMQNNNFVPNIDQNFQNYNQNGYDNAYDNNQNYARNQAYYSYNNNVDTLNNNNVSNVSAVRNNVQMPNYDNQNYAMNNGYVAQNNIQNMSNYNQPAHNYYNQMQDESALNKNKQVRKEKLNTKAKMLIAVYFVIVAVIATLLFINVAIADNKPTSATEQPTVAYNAEVVNRAVTANGEIVEMDTSQPIINYEYEIETNWFEKMCQKISVLLG